MSYPYCTFDHIFMPAQRKPKKVAAQAKDKKINAIELLMSIAERIGQDALLAQMILEEIKAGNVEARK